MNPTTPVGKALKEMEENKLISSKSFEPDPVTRGLTEMERRIEDGLCLLGHIANNTNQKKGFNSVPVNIGQFCALVHTEVAEITQADQVGNPESEKIPGFSSIEEEMADVIIRILSRAEKDGLDVSGACVAKLEFNKHREPLHGKRY